VAKIDALFQFMKDNEASDCHISPNYPPLVRLHGDIVPLNAPPLTAEQAGALIYEILSPEQIKEFEEKWELDCAYDYKGVARFRVNVCRENRGVSGVFRIIPEEMPTMEQLSLPDNIRKLVDVHKGLILVTGPTGSGKSTTLASIINEINSNRKTHIITIEDPIEFAHKHKKSLIHQREVHNHSKSFAAALKSAFREGPDIILVGEMRDLETVSLAMTAAETGHLVFGTLHTNSASKTIDRLIDVFPSDEQSQIRTMLAESLRGVVAQTLFKRFDKKGRIAAFDILINTKAVGNLIREAKTFQIPSMMQTGKKDGMLTFDDYIAKLVQEGKVHPQDAKTFLGSLSPTEEAA
jgi:twitching motility protein PilT